MSNLIIRILITFFAFLKEIFFANPTYQNVIRKNKQLIIMSIFCFTLFITLLFNVEKSLEVVRHYKILEVEYQTLRHKYQIMTNLYGENASEDPDIIREIYACRDLVIEQGKIIEDQKNLLEYRESLINALQRQMITLTSHVCQ